MQRFLISVLGATILSWTILLTFAAKTGEVSIIKDLILSTLLFVASSFTLSLTFYFVRILIPNLRQRGRIKFEETTFVDLRPIWRRSFKMAAVISAFISVLVFLQLEELLNLFNFSLLLAIIILGSIWLRR